MAISAAYSDFFDVSIVMPFYKKLDVFAATLQKHHCCFSRNGMEVIIVMDEPSEKEGVLALIRGYPFINWKVIVNEHEHEWRNPAKALNVGIRNARFRYILVVGPDSELHTDIISIFREKSLFYRNTFFIGQVAFVDHTFDACATDKEPCVFFPYGSIFAEAAAFKQVRGYNEHFCAWGGDDDEIRARLEYAGWKKMFVPEARLLHREADSAGLISRAEKAKALPAELKRKILLPECSIANDESWGTDFDEVLYAADNNPFFYEQLRAYLRQFEGYEIANREMLGRAREVVALVPVHNESKNICGLLAQLEQICDGVILLDDGSEDNTFELADSANLLVKVRKKRNGKFDDLTNRNTLLRLASFVRCDWLFFIDADERLDDRFCDLRAAARTSPSPTICFYHVHLWDDAGMYRVNVPEPSPVDRKGILSRWRMFRKVGHMQIISDTTLHFPAIPYRDDVYIAPVLILHYGMKDAAVRSFKKQRYEREDPQVQDQPDKYSYFNDKDVELASVSDIAPLYGTMSRLKKR